MKKVIKCGQFFDSNTGKVLKDIAVVIDGNKITEVAPAADVCCKDAEVIDLSGKFVMPGLIDAHGHAGHALLRSIAADTNAMWMKIITPRLSTSNDPKNAGILLAIITIRTIIIRYILIRNPAPSKPYSSTITAKIKSDADCGSICFKALFPGPIPVIPP